jgi:hypothetical protein
MSCLVDMNVFRQPVKTSGHRGVIAWLEREQAEYYTSARSKHVAVVQRVF